MALADALAYLPDAMFADYIEQVDNMATLAHELKQCQLLEVLVMNSNTRPSLSGAHPLAGKKPHKSSCMQLQLVIFIFI
jgi:hypothetical protein